MKEVLLDRLVVAGALVAQFNDAGPADRWGDG